METKENNQPSQLDIRCSNSCARAGLTILLFSALAFAMLSPLEKGKQLEAFGDYVTLRLELKGILDQLEADPCWKVLISREGNQVTSWVLSRLMEIYCEVPPITKPKLTDPSTPSEFQKEKKAEKNSTNLKQDKTPPAPPTLSDIPAVPKLLSISFPMWQFNRIADILTTLGDGKLLYLARSYSYQYNWLIYRWEVLRSKMILDKSEIPVITGPPEKMLKGISTIPREKLIKNLTLDNIKELSNYELPELSGLESNVKELTHFNLLSMGIPVGLISATFFIELGLIFSLAYFWLFQHEAKLSKNYPAPGTLFGVFQRTFISRNMFTAFMTLPAISSTLLAIKTFPYTYWTAVCVFFVVVFSITIARNWLHGMKADFKSVLENHIPGV